MTRPDFHEYDGRVWFSTAEGLASLNGAGFTDVWRHRASEGNDTRGTFVASFDGGLWLSFWPYLEGNGIRGIQIVACDLDAVQPGGVCQPEERTIEVPLGLFDEQFIGERRDVEMVLLDARILPNKAGGMDAYLLANLVPARKGKTTLVYRVAIPEDDGIRPTVQSWGWLEHKPQDWEWLDRDANAPLLSLEHQYAPASVLDLSKLSSMGEVEELTTQALPELATPLVRLQGEAKDTFVGLDHDERLRVYLLDEQGKLLPEPEPIGIQMEFRGELSGPVYRLFSLQDGSLLAVHRDEGHPVAQERALTSYFIRRDELGWHGERWLHEAALSDGHYTSLPPIGDALLTEAGALLVSAYQASTRAHHVLNGRPNLAATQSILPGVIGGQVPFGEGVVVLRELEGGLQELWLLPSTSVNQDTLEPARRSRIQAPVGSRRILTIRGDGDSIYVVTTDGRSIATHRGRFGDGGKVNWELLFDRPLPAPLSCATGGLAEIGTPEVWLDVDATGTVSGLGLQWPDGDGCQAPTDFRHIDLTSTHGWASDALPAGCIAPNHVPGFLDGRPVCAVLDGVGPRWSTSFTQDGGLVPSGYWGWASWDGNEPGSSWSKLTQREPSSTATFLFDSQRRAPLYVMPDGAGVVFVEEDGRLSVSYDGEAPHPILATDGSSSARCPLQIRLLDLFIDRGHTLWLRRDERLLSLDKSGSRMARYMVGPRAPLLDGLGKVLLIPGLGTAEEFVGRQGWSRVLLRPAAGKTPVAQACGAGRGVFARALQPWDNCVAQSRDGRAFGLVDQWVREEERSVYYVGLPVALVFGILMLSVAAWGSVKTVPLLRLRWLSSELRLHPSPYKPGTPVKGPDFYCRADLMASLTQELQSPQVHWVLSDHRRTGKTSILLELKRRLDEGGRRYTLCPLPVYLSLERTSEGAKFFQLLWARLSTSTELTEGPLSPTFLDPQDEEEAFINFCDLMELLHIEGHRRVLLLLDEVQKIARADPGTPGLEAAQRLRSCTAEPWSAHLGWVCAGVIEKLSAPPTSLDSDLLAVGPVRRVGPFSESEARELIRGPVKDGIVRFSDEAVERLLEIGRGNPYVIQSLCHLTHLAAITDAVRTSWLPRVSRTGLLRLLRPGGLRASLLINITAERVDEALNQHIRLSEALPSDGTGDLHA